MRQGFWWSSYSIWTSKNLKSIESTVLFYLMIGLKTSNSDWSSLLVKERLFLRIPRWATRNFYINYHRMRPESWSKTSRSFQRVDRKCIGDDPPPWKWLMIEWIISLSVYTNITVQLFSPLANQKSQGEEKRNAIYPLRSFLERNHYDNEFDE